MSRNLNQSDESHLRHLATAAISKAALVTDSRVTTSASHFPLRGPHSSRIDSTVSGILAMGSDFPVPRDQLPSVEVTPHERQARKLQMERMLLGAIDEYNHFRDVEQGRVDPSRWKLISTQESLQLFRERHVGSGGYKPNSSVAQSFSNSDDDSSQQNNAWEDYSIDGASAAALVEGKQKLKSMLLVGEIKGRVENAIYAVLTKNNPELALVLSFLHDDVADCAILNELEGPTLDAPLQFLGYKWMVKKSPGGGRIIKHRDVLYLEYCGITTTNSGEELGYLMIESVDLPSFPEFTNRNCLRAVQSFAILMRQKNDVIMEVFMTGVLQPAGKIIRPLTSILTSPTMFMVGKVTDLAECKILTKMVLSHRQARDDQLYNRLHRPTSCSLCHQKRKFYNGVSLVDCSICGQVTCTRCQIHKRIFIAEGILGRFHRVGCCKTCVITADRSRPIMDRVPSKMSITTSLSRQNSAKDIIPSDPLGLPRPRSSSESSLIEFNNSTAIHAVRTASSDAGTDEEIALSRRSSFDLPSSYRSMGSGITLLPASSKAQGLDESRTLHSTKSASALVLLPDDHLPPRSRSGSSATRSQPEHRGVGPASPPSFTASAPARTYDLRGQLAPTTTPPITPSRSFRQQPSTPNELYARMMELRRLAESTYQTTQQNQMYLNPPTTPQRVGSSPLPRPSPDF